MIPKALLLSLLASLSFHEAREVYGLTKLQLPWVAVELVIHAMIVRRMMDFEVPEGLQCIEFFAGTQMSSQVAKAFEELGLTALAFDIDRCLDETVLALLAWAVGAFPILEQPRQSLMTALPSWQSVVGYFQEAAYRTSSGEKKVAGGKGLKSTQYYTPEFGRGLASWWMAHGPVSAGRKRKQWTFLQSSDLSINEMKD
ncbi:unnamed protein product [Durusdinium trenchii]|uniref:Uncharacterized protein n=1 Tax=Durusdinium trenchii TaxID=1381693 RepID=A0ABP0JFV1_9DINO